MQCRILNPNKMQTCGLHKGIHGANQQLAKDVSRFFRSMSQPSEHHKAIA